MALLPCVAFQVSSTSDPAPEQHRNNVPAARPSSERSRAPGGSTAVSRTVAGAGPFPGGLPSTPASRYGIPNGRRNWIGSKKAEKWRESAERGQKQERRPGGAAKQQFF
jgi:hypothetical protein